MPVTRSKSKACGQGLPEPCENVWVKKKTTMVNRKQGFPVDVNGEPELTATFNSDPKPVYEHSEQVRQGKDKRLMEVANTIQGDDDHVLKYPQERPPFSAELVRLVRLMAPSSEFSKKSQALFLAGKARLKTLNHLLELSFKGTHGNWVNGKDEDYAGIEELGGVEGKTVGCKTARSATSSISRKNSRELMNEDPRRVTYVVTKDDKLAQHEEYRNAGNLMEEARSLDTYDISAYEQLVQHKDYRYEKRIPKWAGIESFLDGQLYLNNPLLLDSLAIDPLAGNRMFEIFPPCITSFNFLENAYLPQQRN